MTIPAPTEWDVVIVGAGPAGLSCALLLGRCRRRVLVCSQGPTRNARSLAVHGLITRDGTPPAQVLAAARADLARYPEVVLREARVASVTSREHGHVVHLEDGRQEPARVVVLATGITDQLPDLPGLDACYGISVHHCPYCDAFEVSGKPLAVIGTGAPLVGLALTLTRWSRSIVVYPHGQAEDLDDDQRSRLARAGIELELRPVQRIEGTDGHVRAVVLEDGTQRPCAAIFITTSCQPGFSEIARLCKSPAQEPTVPTEKYGETGTPGIYVVGDASRDAQLVVVAAAEGAGAAVAINKLLTTEDLERDGQQAVRR